jgi:xylan 1,4-beta-xylosidase
VNSARDDWEARSGHVRSAAAVVDRLAAPGELLAEPGRGQVTLAWHPVPGVAGYLLHRADRRDGPFQRLEHGGHVHAVPGCRHADTTGRAGVEAWYAVASVAVPDAEPGPLSAPVPGARTRRAPRPWT